ncbi:unnamed protein product [Symbiodinium sp. KB8]|nr:unnamed protein product [Symbiodinium sp. KB8]
MTFFRGSRALSVVKLGPTDMAFFHQTNALNSRANYSIRSVRVNLPYSPYYLLSDGGPDFSEAAGEFNVSTFRAEGMHLSQSFNPNFTCQGHLQRIAQAARWASQHGAAYLMIWEDDTRMLKPMQTIPDVDLVTMGNVGNKHVGFWNSGIREKSMKTPAEQLAPADQRRVKQQDKFAARRGYSAGPGSIFRIDPFLKAIEATPASDLQAMYTYTEQDMCWEDFAIGNDLRIRRNPEVQQVTWAFNDGEFVGQTAVDCGCAERFSGKERFWSGLEQLAEFMSVLPFTILQAASLASANVALTHIYPSYHEMIQSTTPLFTLVSSMIFDGRRYNCWAYWAMLPVCGGAVISSWSEANFSLLGSALSALAVAFRALKTILQGRLLCEQKVDSITLCYYMAPYNLAIFSIASAAVEGIQPVRQLLGFDSTFVEQVYLAGSLLTSCILACAFNVASYLIIKHMSPVGATVIANAKTPATILTSVFIFGNSVGALQILGFAVTILGVWLHSQKGRPIKV